MEISPSISLRQLSGWFITHHIAPSSWISFAHDDDSFSPFHTTRLFLLGFAYRWSWSFFLFLPGSRGKVIILLYDFPLGNKGVTDRFITISLGPSLPDFSQDITPSVSLYFYHVFKGSESLRKTNETMDMLFLEILLTPSFNI